MSNDDNSTYPVVLPGGVTMVKDTNPKDSVGVRKVPMSTVSAPVSMEVGLAMLEGARKYGRHNYRIAGVRASVYYDASMRHLMAWWEGEDLDPDSELSHITKAIVTLYVLRDSMIQENWEDDRPPASPEDWVNWMNYRASRVIDRTPTPVPAFTAIGAKSNEYADYKEDSTPRKQEETKAVF